MTDRSGRFGGFGLDRMLVDYEVSEDAPVEAAPADTPNEGDVAPEPEAAPAAWSADNPEFLDAVDARAAEIINTRLSQAQPPQQAPQPQADPVDPNVFLDPMSEDFGQNFLAFNQQRDQWLLDQVKGMLDGALGPVQQQYQRDQDAAADTLLTDALKGQGVTSERGVSLATDLAKTYYPDQAARFGHGQVAADAAIRKAAAAIRELEGTAATTGRQQEVDHLTALTGARQEPGGGGSGLRMVPTGGDEMEVARRYGGSGH